MRFLILVLMSLLTCARAGLAGEPAKNLASLTTIGGLTPRGLGHSEFKIGEDGTFEWYDQMQDETLPSGGQPGNPKGFNGWSKTQMTPEELVRLREAVAAVDFSAIKLDPARQRPSGTDGGDMTLELASPKGPQSIPLWQLEAPASLPVVDLMNTLQAKYARTSGPAPATPSPSPSPDR